MSDYVVVYEQAEQELGCSPRPSPRCDALVQMVGGLRMSGRQASRCRRLWTKSWTGLTMVTPMLT